jgi:hypothetical protein
MPTCGSNRSSGVLSSLEAQPKDVTSVQAHAKTP